MWLDPTFLGINEGMLKTAKTILGNVGWQVAKNCSYSSHIWDQTKIVCPWISPFTFQFQFSLLLYPFFWNSLSLGVILLYYSPQKKGYFPLDFHRIYTKSIPQHQFVIFFLQITINIKSFTLPWIHKKVQSRVISSTTSQALLAFFLKPATAFGMLTVDEVLSSS